MYKDVHFYRASALFSAVSLYLLRLFSKGFVFPLPAIPAVSGKTSGKEFLLFLFLAFLADCCILFTITIKKTKCSTALSAPIFLPLLFCSRGVFPLNRSQKPHLHYMCGKKDFCFNRCPGYYLPYFCLSLTYGRNSFCEKESVF